jgi:hypothetical protein
MQLHKTLTTIFRNTAVLIRRLAYLLTRKTPAALGGDLGRELYGMDMREQVVVRQVISMAGQSVTVRWNTVGFNKQNKLCLLEKGNQLKISKNPFLIDQQGNVYVILLDQGYKYLAIKLSDYISDIYVSDQG